MPHGTVGPGRLAVDPSSGDRHLALQAREGHLADLFNERSELLDGEDLRLGATKIDSPGLELPEVRIR